MKRILMRTVFVTIDYAAKRCLLVICFLGVPTLLHAENTFDAAARARYYMWDGQILENTSILRAYADTWFSQSLPPLIVDDELIRPAYDGLRIGVRVERHKSELSLRNLKIGPLRVGVDVLSENPSERIFGYSWVGEDGFGINGLLGPAIGIGAELGLQDFGRVRYRRRERSFYTQRFFLSDDEEVDFVGFPGRITVEYEESLDLVVWPSRIAPRLPVVSSVEAIGFSTILSDPEPNFNVFSGDIESDRLIGYTNSWLFWNDRLASQFLILLGESYVTDIHFVKFSSYLYGWTFLAEIDLLTQDETWFTSDWVVNRWRLGLSLLHVMQTIVTGSITEGVDFARMTADTLRVYGESSYGGQSVIGMYAFYERQSIPDGILPVGERELQGVGLAADIMVRFPRSDFFMQLATPPIPLQFFFPSEDTHAASLFQSFQFSLEFAYRLPRLGGAE